VAAEVVSKASRRVSDVEGPASSTPSGPPTSVRAGRLRLPSLPREEDATESARRRVLESRLSDPDDESPPASVPPRRAPPPPQPPQEALGPAAPRAPIRLDSVPPRQSALEAPPDRRRPNTPPMERGVGVSLSPRMTALFGGLFGLATVTTIVALLVQGVPPRDDRSVMSSLPQAGTDAPGSTDAPAPTATPKKRVRNKLPPPWRVSDMAKDPGVRIVEDTMNRRSFVDALGEKGVPKDQVYRILKAFDGVRKFDKTGKNDKFIVALDRASQKVKGFELVVSPFEVWQAREENGVLTASTVDMKLADAEVTGSFYVGKNLAKSIEWGGLEPAITKALDDAFLGRISSDGFEEGGTVRVIAVETTALGDFAKYKTIVAAEYKPADPTQPAIRAYSFDTTDAGGAHGYFDDKGRQPDGSGWGAPIVGAPITSHFNPKRMHPVLHKIMPHNGTDYGAPTGTPIYAVFRGKLTHVGPAGACGNMVSIMHPNGVESGYCHMSKIAPGLKLEGKVGTKQLIGYVGTTGRSTGPHLHFWTKRDGKFFDSETLKIDGFRVLPPSLRGEFAKRKAELDARLDALPMPDPPPAEPVAAPAAAPKDAPADGAPPDPSGDDEAVATPAADDKATKKSKKSDKDASKGASEVDPGEGEDLMGPDLSH
jgi:murein DD-endopeptidase MepM/ murein hydrolase activator NlpD